MASDESSPTSAPPGTETPPATAPQPARRRTLPLPVLGLVGVLVVVALLTTLRTATAGPSIKDILADPTTYEGQTVTVRGTVHGAVELPLVGGGYKLVDDTGADIMVKAKDVPGQGTKTTVTGVVKVPMQLGSRRLVYLSAAGEPDEK